MDRIVFVGVFSPCTVRTITHEPLNSVWCNFARTCTSTTFRTLLNFKVICQRKGQGRVGFFCVFLCAWCCGYPRIVLSVEQGLMVLLPLSWWAESWFPSVPRSCPRCQWNTATTRHWQRPATLSRHPDVLYHRRNSLIPKVKLGYIIVRSKA